MFFQKVPVDHIKCHRSRDEGELSLNSQTSLIQKWYCANCITSLCRSVASLWSKLCLLASVTNSPCLSVSVISETVLSIPFVRISCECGVTNSRFVLVITSTTCYSFDSSLKMRNRRSQTLLCCLLEQAFQFVPLTGIMSTRTMIRYFSDWLFCC